MQGKRRNRKPAEARNRRGTCASTKEKGGQVRPSPAKPAKNKGGGGATAEKLELRAEKTAARLLPAAERQAKKGYPRLLAEIFRFIRPDANPIIVRQRIAPK